MELELVRDNWTDRTTMGRLYLPSLFILYTLEPETVPPGQHPPMGSAIQPGRFKVSKYLSPKFGYHVPLLNDVPHFTAVEMHKGTIRAHTRACILVGTKRIVDGLIGTVPAFARLMAELDPIWARNEEVWINVQCEPKRAV